MAEAHSAIRDQVLVRGRCRMFLFSTSSKTGCDKPPVHCLREAFFLDDQTEHQILKISEELLENIQRYFEIHSVFLPECNVAMGVEAAFLTSVFSVTALNFSFLMWVSTSVY
jgi:hypothetical protein